MSAALPRARWNFWDGIASTPSVTYEVSAPVRDTYLPFFEQYTRSVTGWSPDSAAFAFAGRPDGGGEGADGIWVQLVGSTGGGSGAGGRRRRGRLEPGPLTGPGRVRWRR